MAVNTLSKAVLLEPVYVEGVYNHRFKCLVVKHGGGTVQLHHSGKVTIFSKTPEMALEMMDTLGAAYTDLETLSITYVGTMGTIGRFDLFQPPERYYEPELFIGMRSAYNGMKASIFSTGKVVIMGAKTIEDAEEYMLLLQSS